MAWGRLFKQAVDNFKKHWPKIRDEIIYVQNTAREITSLVKGLRDDLSPITRKWWSGKTIAVIGPRACGKDSFYSRLRGEPVPEGHTNTKGVNRIKTFTFKRGLPDGTNFTLKCKGALNVGGETEERARHWHTACKSADVIFYMIDLSKFENPSFEYSARISDDLGWLGAYIGDFEKKAMVHILANKLDLLVEDTEKASATIERLQECFDGLEKVARDKMGKYETRLTGVSPISMTDDTLFGILLPKALQAVHEAVRDE